MMSTNTIKTKYVLEMNPEEKLNLVFALSDANLLLSKMLKTMPPESDFAKELLNTIVTNNTILRRIQELRGE